MAGAHGVRPPLGRPASQGRAASPYALLVIAILAICVLGAPARAQPFEQALLGLAGDSFADKEAAIAALAALGDGRAVRPLEALREGKLHVESARNRLVIAEDAGGGTLKISDAVSG